MKPLALLTLTFASVAALVGVGGAVAVATGWYDVSAASSHTVPVYRLLEKAMHQAVRVRAREIAVPRLDDPARLAHGAVCYRDHCVQCHGGPGVAPADLAMGLQPLPGPLMDAARRWRPAELYWITHHGIKMSGMPAWGMRLTEEDLWALTAFLARLPDLSPSAYASTLDKAGTARCPTLSASCREGRCRDEPAAATAAHAPSGPWPARGPQRDAAARLALQQYACIACHVTPGVIGPDTHVGPPLVGLGRQQRLAGRWPNNPEELARWLQTPHALDPRSAMPALGVTPEHARLMASYLLDQP